MLTLRDQILFRFTDLRGHNDFTLTLGVLTERDCAVDLGDHGKLFRLTGFKELGNTWQTTGDVLGLGGFTRDLRQNITSADHSIFFYQNIGTNRHHTALRCLVALILDRNTWTFIGCLGFDNNLT